MAIEQGKLSSTDTTKDMTSFYNDVVAKTISDVDRIIHNKSQFVRFVVQRPQPTQAYFGSVTAQVDATHVIDNLFGTNPTSGVNTITVGFSKSVRTVQIVVYSASFIDPTSNKWSVRTSLNNIESEFSNSNFLATGLSVSQSIVTDVEDPAVGQFKFTVSFSSPPVGSTLPFWRIGHNDAGAFNNLTEVQILPPLVPTLSYFNSNGSFASSFQFEKSNILDVCYDGFNNRFYTIRFNDQNVGTTSLDLDDDFSEAKAGTASGTTNFNPSRWTESTLNTQFLRSGGQLVFNTTTGAGQLETNYSLSGNADAYIEFNTTALTAEPSWFDLRFLDSNNRVILSEGFGKNNALDDVYFSSHVRNIQNFTTDSEIKEMRPLWHNTVSGTDTFSIIHTGSNAWTVSGTLTGALANATTGVVYNTSVASTTPIEFLITAPSTPANGENFVFDLVSSEVIRVLATGTLQINRASNQFSTSKVFTSPFSAPSENLTVELFARTSAAANFAADNYQVGVSTTSSGVFPDIAVFTIERVDAEGDVITPNGAVIESLDVIGDPSLGYNDFLNDRVQIACTSVSGTGAIFIKINDTMYKYANNVSLTSDNGSSASVSTLGQIAKEGTKSLQWTVVQNNLSSGFLTYLDYDQTLDILKLRTMSDTALTDTTATKEAFLNVSDYATNRYEVFYDQNDYDTLYYVDSSFNLRSWNLDEGISAFMSVNAQDTTMAAGTSQQTDIEAEVINAWGAPLSGKTVTFAVTSGDGVVSPASDTTDVEGKANTQFTVGSTVGISQVTATVTET